MKIKKVNLAEKLASFSEHWSPRIVGELNGQHVKLAKVKGDFIMHNHENEDELFFVVDGQLFIELEAETITLNPGELVVVPKGVNHRPYANEETSIMLFEPASTVNTGSEKKNHLTKENLPKI